MLSTIKSCEILPIQNGYVFISESFELLLQKIFASNVMQCKATSVKLIEYSVSVVTVVSSNSPV